MSIQPLDNMQKRKNVSFFDPVSEREAARKKAMAEMLLQKGDTPLQNETAGGMTVARSPWEFADKGASNAMGTFLLSKADEQAADIEKTRQQAMAEALSNINTNPQAAAAILAQDPRTSEMAARLMQSELEYGRDQSRFDREMAFKERQLEALNKRASMGGVNTPAAMQIANQMFALEQAANDPNLSMEERFNAQRQYNLLGQSAKTYGFDRGFQANLFNTPQQPPQPSGQNMLQQGLDMQDQFVGGQNPDPLATGVPQGQMPQGGLPVVDVNQPRPTQMSAPAISTVPGFDEALGGREATKEQMKLRAKYMEEGFQKLPQVQRSLQDAELRNENVMRVSNQVAQVAQGAFTTGFTGSILSATAGTPAYDLRQNLQTLEATAAFDTLQNMRDNSPTGGALGQVTERELDLLKAAYSNLSNSQSYEQFMQNLEAFNMQNQRSLQNARAAYEQDYQRFGGKLDQFLPAPQSVPGQSGGWSIEEVQ